MKSILLASASIVAFAGAAAAEVTFGGSAELGYNDTDAASTSADDQGFFWDADLSVTMTQALNNGLTATAKFGIDVGGTDDGESGNDNTQNDLDAVDFALSLTSETAGLHFGNVDTAASRLWDSAGEMAADPFSAKDGDIVLRGDVMFGGVDASVSYFVYEEELQQLQVAAVGTFGNFEVGLAYQAEETDLGITGDPATPNAVLGLYAQTTFAGATVQVAYAQWTGIGTQEDLDSIGIEASYPVGPVTLGAYYVIESSENNAFGISADYASGPITVAVNYEDTTDGDETWSIEGTYALDVGTILVGLTDAGEDMYAAVRMPLGDNSNLLVSFADDGDSDAEDEIGDPDFKEGLTASVGFSF